MKNLSANYFWLLKRPKIRICPFYNSLISQLSLDASSTLLLHLNTSTSSSNYSPTPLALSVHLFSKRAQHLPKYLWHMNPAPIGHCWENVQIRPWHMIDLPVSGRGLVSSVVSHDQRWMQAQPPIHTRSKKKLIKKDEKWHATNFATQDTTQMSVQ